MTTLNLEELYLKYDLSYGSVTHLIERISSKSDLKNPWFVDHPFSEPATTKSVNTVFFGNYLKRFLESGMWTSDSFKMYVLSRPVKDVFVRAFGFNDNEIGVIDRYQLFPAEKTHIPLPDLNIKQDWVYAGRLSFSKKILPLLSTVHELQTRYNSPIQLHLFGDFIADDVQFLSPTSQAELKSETLRFIESQVWLHKPILHGFVAENEWLNRTYENPVYVSFSQFPYEDFTVSAALAQQKGWPLILSNWGGHCDVEGANLLPRHLLNPQFEPEEVEILRGQVIAGFIKEKKLEQSDTGTSSLVPIDISLSRLDELRRRFLVNFGAQLKFILKDLKPLAQYRSESAAFFNLEEKCMARETGTVQRDFVSLIADKDAFRLTADNESQVKKSLKEGRNLKTFFLKNLASKAKFTELMKSKKIFCTCPLKEGSALEALVQSLE